MSTFQVLLSALLLSGSFVLPYSGPSSEVLLNQLLSWNEAGSAPFLWVTFLSLLVLMFFFRFDVLGFLAGLIRTLTSPNSFRPGLRTLDQQTAIFLVLAIAPTIAIKILHQHFDLIALFAIDTNVLSSAFFMAGVSAASAVALSIAPSFNKRLRGLNHLRLQDAMVIGILLPLSLHPALPGMIILWSALSMLHYHWEAIFKLSFLVLILKVSTHLALDFPLTLIDAGRELGFLNGIVLTLVSLSTAWIAIDNLQVGFGESSYRMFRWLPAFLAVLHLWFGIKQIWH